MKQLFLFLSKVFNFKFTLVSTEALVTPAKRKAEGKKDTPPAKKAKSEGEGRKN